MRTSTAVPVTLLTCLAALAAGAAGGERPGVFATGALLPPPTASLGQVTAEIVPEGVLFSVAEAAAPLLRLRVAGAAGELEHDSGPSEAGELLWRTPAPAAGGGERGRHRYELSAWSRDGTLVGVQTGEIDLHAGQVTGPAVSALAFDVAGNFAVGGALGVGIASPERAVHIRGSNAVFRMDRSVNTAAFMLVRTDAADAVLKTFVVGVNASGPNDGSFVINDLGASTAGSGSNRLLIDNAGNASFAGEVRAAGFVTASARALKRDIRPLDGALAIVDRLRGVRFAWRDSGEPAIGFIAEEVAAVLPEVVAFDGADGSAAGVDYGRVTAVLVEAAKEQQRQIDGLAAECDALEARWTTELRELRSRLDGEPRAAGAER